MPMQSGDEVTIDGATAEIVIDGYKKGGSLMGTPWREIVYQLPWADSDTFLYGLLGIIEHTEIGTVPARKPPHRYPADERLFCVQAQCSPVGASQPGKDGDIYAADLVQIFARYEVPSFDIGGSDSQLAPGGYAAAMAKWTVTGRTRIVMMNKSALQGQSGETVTKDFPVRVPLEEMRVTFFEVPYIYLNVYRALHKHTNNAIFAGWAIGHVLFDEYELENDVARDGTRVMNLHLTFLAQGIPWNQAAKEDDYGYFNVQGAVGGTPIYLPADLTAALR